MSKNADSVKRAGESAAVLPVAGVGEVDRAQIAQQMAAALVAQGKTDVSSEELAQLVDAVVRSYVARGCIAGGGRGRGCTTLRDIRAKCRIK